MNIIFWGGTGQAKVMRPIAEYYGYNLVAVFDDTQELQRPFGDIPIIHGSMFDSWIDHQKYDVLHFVITIGNPHGHVRKKLSDTLKKAGLIPISLIHPSAVVAESAKIGEGVQMHAGAIVGDEAYIGDYCIINTKASIDHETIIGTGVEVAPGATLCGSINIDDYVTVYAGATILPRIRIGKHAVIGAGSLVNKDVPPNAVVAGVPARILKMREGNFDG